MSFDVEKNANKMIVNQFQWMKPVTIRHAKILNNRASNV